MLSKFNFLSASPLDSLTRGSAPGPRWVLRPQTPVIGSRSALAMSSPTVQKKLPPLEMPMCSETFLVYESSLATVEFE